LKKSIAEPDKIWIHYIRFLPKQF